MSPSIQAAAARLEAFLARPAVRWALKWLGYPSFFLFWFITFCYLTFPYDRLRDYIIQKVEYEATPDGGARPTGWKLSIVELTPSWFTGFEVDGVRLRRAAADEEDRPLDLSIPHAEARASIFSLLTGAPAIAFAAEVAAGEASGEIVLDSGRPRAIQLEVEGVQLRRLGSYGQVAGLPLSGVISGSVRLDLPEDPQQVEGEVRFEARSLQVGDGQAKLQLPGLNDGLTIDAVDAGDVSFALVTTQGVGRVETLTANGPHLELQGAGTVHFATPLPLTRLDLLVRAQFTDAYKQSSPRTQALFMLLEGNPQLRAARTADGALQLRMRGSIASRLRSTPAGRERMPSGE